ncbi:ribonucleotide-diphosphate reductase subunit beta [Aerococcus urinaehominis]|uniref:Ribonucleoside-diphosphate reductase subunit beta n=1 Tax=Aerococcus urinaehominis TaxID=128944 RepID=A0A0X8FKT4_9LACT|nr:class 1b ribonucleoside-diphosphate reductase subunit beta [Aerococcus urinaehominis]AMB99153.1 ribonucleotide-diphosphate reductase subunit beta [Aerococcus urinaehominis]SDM05517.1 ribonucleoside-diphosphate reductase beta chain [Aerococcus urinaehominis]
MNAKHYEAINWNDIEDTVDKLTWEKLTEQFWLDTRIPVSNDLDDWRRLSKAEQDMIGKVFGGLTLLDTLQSEEGAVVMQKDARNQKEEAVFSNMHFMESVHAKSYSTIFITLNTNAEIDAIFDWTNHDDLIQYKAEKINEVYQNGTALQKKAASVLLESFLFYSGFYAPLWYLGNNKLPNVAEIIKLILRDESVHGTYIGYKFQLAFNELAEAEQEELKNWVYGLLYDLYANEEKYTATIYDEIGWTEDVNVFVRYNANKALQNLGFDPLFPDTAEDVNPVVMNGISTGTSNHDFFSQVGNGYLLGEVEAMTDDDYATWATNNRREQRMAYRGEKKRRRQAQADQKG